MRPIATDVAWSVCVFQCLSVTTMSCAETAEPVEMPFAAWTRVGPTNHYLGPGPPGEGAVLEEA